MVSFAIMVIKTIVIALKFMVIAIIYLIIKLGQEMDLVLP